MKLLNRKKILSLALPAMVENVLQMLMGFVDNFLVAQISLLAVSGVTIANNLITVYQALFIALSSAISSLLARSIGERDDEKELGYMADALMVTLFLSLILGFFSIVFGCPLLFALGAGPEVVAEAYGYLLIVGGLIFSLGLLTTFGAILRARGYSKLPMHVSFLTTFLNAVFSLTSIQVFHLGVLGVAGSTVLARLIGIVILVKFLPIKRIMTKMRFKLDPEILSLSLPAAGERLMMRLGDLLILMIVIHFGEKVLAGNAIGETISQFNYMPGLGISTATVILVANHLGRQEHQEIDKLIKESFLLSTLLMFCFSFLVFISSPWLIAGFTNNIEAIEAAKVVLLFSLISVPATSGTLVYTSLWQGLGNARLPFYATSIGMWLIRILAGYFLGVLLKLGLEGVWLATALDNLTRWLILKSAYNKKRKISL
ncbi:MATE family efflux transporter [Streptococcus bovimastitidis]|uniref:Probable multidrug resistance protein NorM n=1 Tax=Streptococcus bovimastitidis TaxID=1856638 RepID=A0A1L8MQI4_9STRE|nr:MATE family efflux transporter [Streptococcus bovimastitidis]OJF72986.1 MATE family efflux transporter [Streptococcus bovimastitidis]